ncbi:DUF3152 domain-containing protein [Streptomyces sp. NPDC048639]|uniref:DUF3152 domain-containing protein n=1 Tax=Streptomyces sp. NPDC048639 TaxID=3365581 RepID=UPI003710C10D
MPRPRQEYIDAFDDDVHGGGPGGPGGRGGRGGRERGARERIAATAPVDLRETEGAGDGAASHAEPGTRRPKGGKGRTFTGIAAAAVITVLAVVAAGEFVGGDRGRAASPGASKAPREDTRDTSRSDNRPAPTKPPAAPVTYDQKMVALYPLDERLSGSGDFATVGGRDKAPGRGEVVRYRVDVEKKLPLDGKLFAQAVQKTLNDRRSWGRGGTRTFERVSSGEPDWVITLASPGTTATWCAKSGLDTTVDNVSCDSASTERVMINAYRWAQGAETYGDDKMLTYREMLINHEVGHRLGLGHEGCPKSGALAPVMMQQTKYLATDGRICKPNAWPYPKG